VSRPTGPAPTRTGCLLRRYRAGWRSERCAAIHIPSPILVREPRPCLLSTIKVNPIPLWTNHCSYERQSTKPNEFCDGLRAIPTDQSRRPVSPRPVPVPAPVPVPTYSKVPSHFHFLCYMDIPKCRHPISFTYDETIRQHIAIHSTAHRKHSISLARNSSNQVSPRLTASRGTMAVIDPSAHHRIVHSVGRCLPSCDQQASVQRREREREGDTCPPVPRFQRPRPSEHRDGC
jgi:hypothetical protein